MLIRDDVPTIADGQQRLATVTIILSHIRDRLQASGRGGSAVGIDSQYIQSIDIDTEEKLPILSLNLEDNDFFKRHIISPLQEPRQKSIAAPRASNRRLLRATKTIEDFFEAQMQQLPAEARVDRLLKWVSFIRNSANVIVVRVSDELGAYRIFETLNDRGLRAGQADLLKNFFFSQASQSRVTEAQNLWNNIGAVLETLGDDESDLLVTYIRHLWITENGPTKERVLAERVKQKIGGSEAAFDFLSTASNSCDDYVALWSHDHPKWENYLPETKKHVETIHRHLQVEQIRPLLFAVARSFQYRRS